MKNQWKIGMALLFCVGAANAGFITIGDAGNAADTSSYGAVGYSFQISVTEVSIAEFQASGAGNGGEDYWNTGSRSVGTAAPACNVSLYEAMKYCNYITTGNTNNGYYSTSDGGATYQSNALSHDAYATANGLTYFVPTEDEWYKAAYYTGNSSDYWSLYANGTDTTPTQGGGATGWNYDKANSSPNYTRDVAWGSEEQGGTVNMMGNVWEWTEKSSGLIRGGNYQNTAGYMKSSMRNTFAPTSQVTNVGFRPVAIPEPASLALLGMLSGCALFIRRAFMM